MHELMTGRKIITPSNRCRLTAINRTLALSCERSAWSLFIRIIAINYLSSHSNLFATRRLTALNEQLFWINNSYISIMLISKRYSSGIIRSILYLLNPFSASPPLVTLQMCTLHFLLGVWVWQLGISTTGRYT